MKNLKTKISILAVALLTIVQFSCSKPENGTNGVDGKTGTANVIYSDWTNVTLQTGIPKAGGISVPAITQEVLDKATVLVYVRLSSVVQLNYYENIGGNINYISNILGLGTVTILSTFPSITLPYRYIIIPGGVSATGKMAKTDYSKMTYSQVCQSLQIPE